MNELKIINDIKNDRQLVNGRELHEFLEVGTQYTKWIERMCEYEFEENTDFVITNEKVDSQKRLRTYEQENHHMTIEMAKEICMLQRSEKGKQARKYFIEVEKAWNSPEKIMARALQISQTKIEHQEQIIDEMRPKAKYFDDLVDRNLLTNLRDTAKMIGIKQNEFIEFLLDNKYIYRNKSGGNLFPYSGKYNELFKVKEGKNKFNSKSYLQTLVTPKGRETFNLLLNKTKHLS